MTEHQNDRGIRLALDRLARQAVPDDLNPWPSIHRRVEGLGKRPRVFGVSPKTRWAWAMAALALFTVLGAATYVATSTLGERLFSQVMGRWGQDYQPELVHEINMSKTIEGITVTLERAYFDDNRVGIEVTASGLLDPQAPNPYHHMSPSHARLMDEQGTIFPTTGGAGLRGQSDILGAELPPGMVKEVVAFDITEAQRGTSGLRLRFSVSIAETDLAEGEDGVIRIVERDGKVVSARAVKVEVKREIGPFTFDFTMPFIPSKDIRVIEVGQTVEVAGVAVRLERVTITPAEVQALLWVERTPEQARMGIGPAMVMLTPPGGWTSDRPQPLAYVVTMLGDTGKFAARFHNNDSLLDKPGERTLTVRWLRGASDEVVEGPWVFRFEMP